PAEILPPTIPTSRRAIYRRLAAIRKALRAWEKLRPALANPTEPLATPISVLLFLQAVAESREALPGVAKVIGLPGSPGGVVAGLMRMPLVLSTLRTLLPAQRRVVALDWRRGYEALSGERARLRELARTTRPQRHGKAGRLVRAIERTPEWILLVLGVLVLLIALVRRNP
ncbi:MAG: hypothetical protein L0241_09870, partial [Planctomycetia bacterium]|nr:hypothetical protein [Planctomycetia bacterium]